MRYVERLHKITTETGNGHHSGHVTIFLINQAIGIGKKMSTGKSFQFYFHLSPTEYIKNKVPLCLGLYNGTFGQIMAGEKREKSFEPLTYLDDSLSNQLAVYLVQELTHSPDEDKEYLKDMVLSLANYLVKLYCQHGEFCSSSKMGIAPFKIKAINNYIQTYIDRNIQAIELAQIAEMSVHHFIRKFKQTTGETPHQYVKRIKMGHAKTLLLNSSENMLQVSMGVGCNNPSHFSQLFKSSYGMSPLRFRKVFQKKYGTFNTIETEVMPLQT